MSTQKTNGQQPTTPWDRLPDETNTAYHRFSIYLELGPDRSISKVGKKLGKSRGYEKHLERWSSKHNWVLRAGKYDEYLQSKTLENKEQIIKSIQGKILRRADELIETLFRISKSDASDRMEAIDKLLSIAGITPESETKQPSGSVLQEFNQIIYNHHNSASNGQTDND